MTLDVLAFAFSVVFLVICGRSHLTARRRVSNISR